MNISQETDGILGKKWQYFCTEEEKDNILIYDVTYSHAMEKYFRQLIVLINIKHNRPL